MPPATKHTRRWFQVDLMTMLVLWPAIVIVWCLAITVPSGYSQIPSAMEVPGASPQVSYESVDDYPAVEQIIVRGGASSIAVIVIWVLARRCSLRTTMLTIAIFLVLLGIRHALIRQRHAAWQWASAHHLRGKTSPPSHVKPVYWWLTALAVPTCQTIDVEDRPDDEKEGYLWHVEEVRRLFPEAYVDDYSQWGPQFHEMH